MTERERERERERGWQREEVVSVVKTTVEENRIVGIRIGLILMAATTLMIWSSLPGHFWS